MARAGYSGENSLPALTTSLQTFFDSSLAADGPAPQEIVVAAVGGRVDVNVAELHGSANMPIPSGQSVRLYYRGGIKKLQALAPSGSSGVLAFGCSMVQ